MTDDRSTGTPGADDAGRRQADMTAEELRAYREGRDLSDGGKYGPLGAGHGPEKDPKEGLRGVMAGTLIMQAISVWLGLTVVARVDGGGLFGTPFPIWNIALLGLAMVVMALLQKKPWALPANIVLQVFGVLAILAHWSMGFVGIFFALVWAYILHLRKNLTERMTRGLLTTQHM